MRHILSPCSDNWLSSVLLTEKSALVVRVDVIRRCGYSSRRCYLGQNDSRVHVGVGTATVIDRLEILWPSGRMETVERLPANASVTFVEGAGVTKSTRFRKAK